MPVLLFCDICDTEFSVIPSRAKTAKYCCYRCHQVGEGRKGGKIRGKQMQAESQGKSYKKINGRHIHRVLMEKKLGRALNNKEIVHHKDGNKLNNDLENLELIQNQSDHIRKHIGEMLEIRRQKHGY